MNEKVPALLYDFAERVLTDRFVSGEMAMAGVEAAKLLLAMEINQEKQKNLERLTSEILSKGLL